MVTAGPAGALGACVLFFFLSLHLIKKACIPRILLRIGFRRVLAGRRACRAAFLRLRLRPYRPTW